MLGMVVNDSYPSNIFDNFSTLYVSHIEISDILVNCEHQEIFLPNF